MQTAETDETTCMVTKGQFSLGYFLAEIFWIAAYLGSFRLAIGIAPTSDALVLAAWGLNLFTFTVAVCGVFGRMHQGFVFGGLAAAGLVGALILFSAMR